LLLLQAEAVGEAVEYRIALLVMLNGLAVVAAVEAEVLTLPLS
jgi:hypothetical protein